MHKSIFPAVLLPYPAILSHCLLHWLENIGASCKVVMGDATTQQNTASRSGDENDASMPTSAYHSHALFLIGEAAFLFPTFKKTFRLVEVEKIFFYPLAVV